MKQTVGVQHETWSSGTKFILAAIGGAIGLANIWRFPYVVGTSGGSAFVVTYIAMSLLFIVPIVIAELMIGRRGKQSMIGSMHKVAIEQGRSRRWSLVGYMGILAMTFIQFFYFVIAGWVLYYFVAAISGEFEAIDAGRASTMFAGLKGDPRLLLICQTSLILITCVIVAKGVRKGVEKSVSWLMPVLFISLIFFVIYGFTLGTTGQAVDFLFSFEFEKLNFEILQLAMGQAFFSVGAGAGFLMTYGAYLPKNVSVVKSSMVILTADVGAALLAGMAIYPIVFAFNLQADAGPGLLFVTLPLAFGEMQYGSVLGTIFFGALLAAIIPTLISGYEQIVCWLIELKRFSRAKASAILGAVIWLGGVPVILSFNLWSDVYLFDFLSLFRGKNIFELYETLAVVFLIPLCGIAIAIFAGWFVSDKACEEELGLNRNSRLFRWWKFLLKYAAPTSILFIFIVNFINI